MKKAPIIFVLFLTIVNTALSQDIDDTIPNWILGANAGFDFTPNGNTYGLVAEADKSFWRNGNNNVSMNIGLWGHTTIGFEGGFDGAYGTTTNSGIHMLLGPSIYLLPSKRLILKPRIFGGWSHKSTNTGIDNEILAIHRSYTDSYHYFARGILFQTGYFINRSIVLTAFVKADLRRLTDGDGILENPGLLYGIGIAKKINWR